jgi:hypothetical protein
VLQSIVFLPNFCFCPFSSILSPCLYLPLPFFPTCHITPPSYTLSIYWKTYCANFTQPQPPAIPDTSTLNYNRNTPKQTQGPKNPAAPTLLPPLIHPISHLLLVPP